MSPGDFEGHCGAVARAATAADRSDQDRSGEQRVRLASVWLIYLREMQDQFRDRRTLFTILVLPVLLYPLVGTLLMQITQFSHHRAARVAIVGQEQLAALPPLIAEDESSAATLSGELSGHPGAAVGFRPEFQEPGGTIHLSLFSWAEFGEPQRTAEITAQWVRDGIYDAVLLVPAELDVLAELGSGGMPRSGQQPSFELVYNVASETSAAAGSRVGLVLQRWKTSWVRRALESLDIQPGVLDPFEVSVRDIAPAQQRQAAFWSKMLPMVMLIWAMTGAFYPAIDLVAGEKERGTLETLLSSPAQRGEIVWGKLAAVTSFSMLTAVLNCGSMLTTGSMVFRQISIGGPATAPPAATLLWLLIALLPLAALFSAVSLGISALARSSKEGQYYLMPLMLGVLPLVMLPMLPGVGLSVGTSLVPVTGMFLLVRALIEGQYALSLVHLPMVLGVTIACLCLAVRWARYQFESEAVLFHGGQTYSLRQWSASLLAGRQRLATPTQAYAAALAILVALFFGKLVLPWTATDFAALTKIILAPQLGMILLPTIVMVLLCTRRPGASLRLRWPGSKVIGASLVVGIALHPSYLAITQWVSIAYPVSESASAAMQPLGQQIAAAPWLMVLLLMAVLPAICEELAFRGFIFGGLLRDQQPLRAILLSAVVFGISHGVLQQSISATVMGLVLGWITWRTGSVIPTILIHMTNNALSVSLPRLAELDLPAMGFILEATGDSVAYQPLWSLVCSAIGIAIFLYYGSLQPDESEAAPLQEDGLANSPSAAEASELAAATA